VSATLQVNEGSTAGNDDQRPSYGSKINLGPGEEEEARIKIWEEKQRQRNSRVVDTKMPPRLRQPQGSMSLMSPRDGNKELAMLSPRSMANKLMRQTEKQLLATGESSTFFV